MDPLTRNGPGVKFSDVAGLKEPKIEVSLGVYQGYIYTLPLKVNTFDSIYVYKIYKPKIWQKEFCFTDLRVLDLEEYIYI